jgi:outer membrane biosynthesis protein TonB
VRKPAHREKEDFMSKRNLNSAAGWKVFAAGLVLAFAATAAAQSAPDMPGITVDLGDAVVMHRSPVTYPIESLRNGLQGTVIVQLTVDTAGIVNGARVISGPEQLRKPVLQSVLD